VTGPVAIRVLLLAPFFTNDIIPELM